MSQIAQQDHKTIVGPFDDGILNNEQKRQLRRACLRGTILDCVLTYKVEGVEKQSKVIFANIHSTAGLVVVFYDNATIGLVEVNCGNFQPDDYTDDTTIDE